MILSDREIRAAVDRGAIKITPMPPAEAWSSTAVDLCLAKDLAMWQDLPGIEICPSNPGYSLARLKGNLTKAISISEDGFVFKPGAFVLGWTEEKISMPYRSRLAARVEGKSSLARLGIGVHITAPTIHAGFGYKASDPSFPGSPLQLEMWNVGPLSVKLHAGMRICQLIFELVDGTPDQGYSGQFAIQGPNAQ